MDMSDRNDLEIGKRNGESSNYNPPGMSGDWLFNYPNFADSSMGIVANVNAMVACGEGVGASSSSGAMVDSFVQTMWEHSVNPASVGFNEMNVHSGMFVPNMSDVLAHNMSQFPADAAFIERAARFSSFSGGHFGELLNPYGMQQSANSYLRGGTMMQGPHEVLSGNAMKTSPYIKPQNSDPNVVETSKDVSVSLEDGAVEGGSAKDRTMVERSHGEAKQRVSMSGNDSDEPEFSGGDAREGASISPSKGLGPKKRKRVSQDAESEQANGTQQQSGEARKKNSEIQQGEQNPSSLGNNSNGKHGKQNSQNSDVAKDEYIHVRTRRGQATNSHSLAERVRREKISERMKFLQDLVPGCSKVTGKAVMLDEIINYVQSLQRQVEFLSMKLATVNPRLDFNMDQLLAKDHMLSARSGPPGIGISPSMSMAYPALHPRQALILQPGLPGVGNFSDMPRRTINSQLPTMGGGGYKGPNQQLSNSWDDELHNVVQMGFNASPPPDDQEANCHVDQGPTTADPC